MDHVNLPCGNEQFHHKSLNKPWVHEVKYHYVKPCATDSLVALLLATEAQGLIYIYQRTSVSMIIDLYMFCHENTSELKYLQKKQYLKKQKCQI